MSREIQDEFFFFLICASTGVLLMFGYDLLRVLRRVFSHGNLMVAIEDFIYWSSAGIAAFGVVFLKNSGALRGFSLVAMLLGMMLYHRSASRLVVLVFVTIFSKIVGIISWL